MSRDKQIYDEFTESGYRNILKLAKLNFKFRNFNSDPLKNGEILWRHDVDFSPHRARALARIENEFQVGSTFLFRIRGSDYSILDREVYLIIKYINSLGHEIGLHFESENINDSQDEIIKSLYQDKHLFELMTGVRPKVFSFHNPTQLMLIMKNYKYADMLNTYSEHYYDTENYISDSNGYWRFRNLIDVLNDESTKKLQVLTHPEWWTPEPLSPRPRIWRAHIGRAHDAHSRYIALLETLGRTDSEKSEE